MNPDPGAYAFRPMTFLICIGQLFFDVGEDRIRILYNPRSACNLRTTARQTGRTIR